MMCVGNLAYLVNTALPMVVELSSDVFYSNSSSTSGAEYSAFSF